MTTTTTTANRALTTKGNVLWKQVIQYYETNNSKKHIIIERNKITIKLWQKYMNFHANLTTKLVKKNSLKNKQKNKNTNYSNNYKNNQNYKSIINIIKFIRRIKIIETINYI